MSGSSASDCGPKVNDWQTVALGDVAEDVTVGRVGPMASEYRAHGVPFLRSQNVLPHRLNLSDIKHIDFDFHQRLRKSALQPGDVVTVRTGKPGATAVVPEDLLIANCSDLVITRPGEKLDPRWLSYYINSVAAGFVASRLVGAVQQHFNVGSARQMLLSLPPIEEQRGISLTLGALDDKIESNRRTLDICSRLLDATSSSLAAVLESVPLSLLAVPLRDAFAPSDLGAELIDHFSIPAFDANGLPDRTSGASVISAKLRVAQPSVLVSRLNPATNRTWFAVPDPGVTAGCSTEFLVLTPTAGVTLGSLWLAVRDEGFRSLLAQRASGTSGSHQRVKGQDALITEVPDVRQLPAAEAKVADELLWLMHQRRVESTRLAALRDALLPELLSGRIRVPEAGEAVESALT